MFTGIIETTGRITDLQNTAGGLLLCVDVSGLAAAPSAGASVAVNGVCLTALEPALKQCAFDVVRETLRRTNLGALTIGQRVNLECSLQLASRLDGHFLQGHVDATVQVDRVLSSPAESVVWFSHDQELTPLLVPKGAIAINGVSLTIADVDRRQFSVALIPTTLQRTNLAELQVGHRVNVETDIMARTILHQLKTLLAETQFESATRPLHEQVAP